MSTFLFLVAVFGAMGVYKMWFKIGRCPIIEHTCLNIILNETRLSTFNPNAFFNVIKLTYAAI